jgi:hypothetical protein
MKQKVDGYAENDPLALKVLWLPYSLSLKLVSIYSKLVFAPFNILLELLTPFIFSERFIQGSGSYYAKLFLLRGGLVTLLLALWVAAVLTPLGVIYSIDKYFFGVDFDADRETFIMTTVFTVFFASILGFLNLKNRNTQTRTLAVFKLVIWFLQDLLSAALTILTIFMVLRAKVVFEGHFDGEERRYLRFITFQFIKSILDWLLIGFRILLTVYPVRKVRFEVLVEYLKSTEANTAQTEFKEQMILVTEGLYTLRELFMLPVHIVFYFLINTSSRRFRKRSMMQYLVAMSFVKIWSRLSATFSIFLFLAGYLLSFVVNGPLIHLNLRTYKEVKARAQDYREAQLKQMVSNTDDIPLDPQGYMSSILSVPWQIMINSFIKYLVIPAFFMPSLLSIMKTFYTGPHVDEAKRLPSTVNKYMFLFKFGILETDERLSIDMIYTKYGNLIWESILANSMLLLVLFLNPMTFCQLVYNQIYWVHRIELIEDVRLKNDEIFKQYPGIFMDLPTLIIFIGVFILTLHQIPLNKKAFAYMLFNRGEPLTVSGELRTRKPYFFQNVRVLTGLLIQLLLLDVMWVTGIAYYFILPKEYFGVVWSSRSSHWFEISFRRRSLGFTPLKYLLAGYYELRKMLLKKNCRYRVYIEMLQKEELPKLMNGQIIEDPVKLLLHRLEIKYFSVMYFHVKAVFKVRWNTTVSNWIISLCKLIKKDSIFDECKKHWADNVENLEKLGHFHHSIRVEREFATKVMKEFRNLILKTLFKLASLLLLWRLPTFAHLMQTGPFTNPDPAVKKDAKLAIRIYKFSFSLLMRDLTYQWFLSTMLFLSPTDRRYVNQKYKELILETPLLTEEIINTQFEQYWKVKKLYVSYVLDDLLLYAMIGISYVFSYRRNLFKRIRLLTTLPQLENIDARNVNILMLTIILKDWLALIKISIPLLLSPCRLYSFILYVYDGQFSEDLTTEVKYNKFESAVVIRTSLDKNRQNLVLKVYSGFGTDIIVMLGIILTLINLMRVYFLLEVFKKLKFKYYQKKTAQQRPFFDEPFSNELRTLVKDVAKETKEDLLCWIAIGIIFFGVYEIQETYERTKKLLMYRWRHSELYRWLNRPKKEPTVSQRHNQVLLENLNWMCLVNLGEFLTMQDRLKITVLNKKTRDYYLSTPFIWIKHYRSHVNPNIADLTEKISSIPVECLNKFREELAENNSKEIDFKLGVRFILKEEAIRSVLSLPQLVSSPYLLIFKLREYIQNKGYLEFTNINELLRRYNEDAQQEHTAWQGLPEEVAPRIVYRFRFRHQQLALTTEAVPEEFRDRMKGFEVLETVFYKFTFFLFDLGVRLYGLLIHHYEYTSNTPMELIRNIFFALLQLLSIPIVCMSLWYLLDFHYKVLKLDFIHGLLGPLGIHILWTILGFMMALHPEYANRRFNPLGIFLIMKNGFVLSFRTLAVPVVEIVSKFTRFVMYRLVDSLSNFFNSILGAIRDVSSMFFRLYTLPVSFATKILIGRGSILELIHLVIVICWISIPAYFAYQKGGGRNISIGIAISLGNIGVAIRVIRKQSRRNIGRPISAEELRANFD